MSASKAEADVIFNRANVALARSQRLIASWLPPKTADELADTKTEEELQREEDEIFTAVPEKLGLGAPLPNTQADGSWNRTELSSNDKLRKQLLGKNFRKMTANSPHGVRTSNTEKKTQSPSPAAQADAESDEEEGRSSVGKSKNKRTYNDIDAAAKDKGQDGISPDENSRGTRRKKPNSYLDELLSARSKKKTKR